MQKLIMPLGLDSFEEIRLNAYYYIDKTEFISKVLEKPFKVNLFTRPRRFGKTLIMDTLASFLDIRRDNKLLFDGLKIMENRELCDAWLNQYPVIFLTLKEVDDANFESALKKLAVCICDLCKAHSYLLDSATANPGDRELFLKYQSQTADSVDLQNALYVLSRMMDAHFGKPAILLIDEYDVPLAQAMENGYYKDMLNVIRGMLNKALKTNPFLKFAVLTGCLRISKESIFTGTNNFVTDTVSGERFNKYFGFTQAEVDTLLQDTGLESHREEIRRWYDGYHFGSADIYCPWDVLNHVDALLEAPDTPPRNYWESTSHNGVLRTFIELANNGQRPELDVNDKFETLLAGGCIEEPLEENLTYDTLHSSEANLWGLLYLTGYLTLASPCKMTRESADTELRYYLKIPNEEVRSIFCKTIVGWMHDRSAQTDRSELFSALWQGDAEKASCLISDLLFDTISFYDYKEDFYHAFVAGIFTGSGYAVKSNREHGTGRADLVIKDRTKRRVMILEFKHADSEEHLEKECIKAGNQITDMQYAEEFRKGYRTVICYGIAFFQKQCLVMAVEKA